MGLTQKVAVQLTLDQINELLRQARTKRLHLINARNQMATPLDQTRLSKSIEEVDALISTLMIGELDALEAELELNTTTAQMSQPAIVDSIGTDFTPVYPRVPMWQMRWLVTLLDFMATEFGKPGSEKAEARRRAVLGSLRTALGEAPVAKPRPGRKIEL